jgi:hypothetical protein
MHHAAVAVDERRDEYRVIGSKLRSEMLAVTDPFAASM